MPQVASDPKVHAPSLHMPRVIRPAPSDRAPSPFESLIEDTSPPAEPAPPQPSKVAKSDDKQAPEKSKDCKAEPNNDTKPAKPDEAVTGDEEPADGNVSRVDGKKTAKSDATGDVGDSIQAKADPEPDTGQKTDDADATAGDGVVNAANSAAPSIIPAAAQTPNPTPDDNKQVEQQPPQQLALVADATPKMKGLGEGVPKAVAGKKIEDSKGKQLDGGDQVETDQATVEADDDSRILNNDATPQHAANKPKTESADGDKPHAPQIRSDAVTSNHRPDSGAPTPASHSDLAGAGKMSVDNTTAQLPIPNTATHSTANVAAPAASTLQPSPQPVAVPLSGVAIEIAGKAIAGKNRFEIRLDPPELGRIEVRLDVDRDGNVTSRLTVDRPDTLDLLRRDSAGLERALQDAGLKTTNNGLQFSLRDQSMNGQQSGTSPDATVLVANDESLPSIDIVPQRYRLAGQGSGLDIRV